MKKALIFLPLTAFLAWAVWYLASPGPRPFLQRWIEVSMGFLLALVGTLGLKNLLLDQDKPEGRTGGDDDGGRS